MLSQNVKHVENVKILGLPIIRRVYQPLSVKTYLFGVRVSKRKCDTANLVQASKNNNSSIAIDDKSVNRLTKMSYSVSKILFNQNKIKLKDNEKIRIHFLYIADSYWPSWNSLYKACVEDDNIEVKLIFLNTFGTSLYTSQFENAEKFLKENNIQYISYDEYFPEIEKPHILFYQTPYDTTYSVFRKVRPDFVTEQGIRVAYLSYGIEYDRSITNKRVQDLHYNHLVHKLGWNIFVMHQDVKDGFYLYCKTGGAHVRVSGHPKFDNYMNRKSVWPQEIKDKAKGRKTIAIQLHCYNDSDCTGKKRIHSVPFKEHVKILEMLKQYKDYFFIYTIHPAYRTRNVEKKFCTLAEYTKFIYDIQNAENMYLYEGNHQDLIINADAFITENSSLMIEMGFFNKSVLYMYDVPIALKPFSEKLADTFHHGHTWSDVLNFLENVVFKNDELLHLREMYREDIFPKAIYDGKIGFRIKEYICQELRGE